MDSINTVWIHIIDKNSYVTKHTEDENGGYHVKQLSHFFAQNKGNNKIFFQLIAWKTGFDYSQQIFQNFQQKNMTLTVVKRGCLILEGKEHPHPLK